ncbi:MAG: PAS domain S-box protein [Anaerolineaceae bacterium]|nr:PAS domain S-box protein [Anaerolineaceae bacterium]
MKSLSILCLEDNEFDVELIKANIEANDIEFDLQHVETRAEFIKALENGPITGKDENAIDGQFDIILTDYSLPAFNGMLAITLAAEMCPEVPIIMVSGAIGEENAIEIMKKGATDYVMKQRMERLVPTILRALEEAEELKARKLAEEALKESEEQLQTLINAMPDFVCFKDGDGRWLKVNDAGTRIFQLDGIDCRGKKDSELAERNSQLQGAFLTCQKSDAEAWDKGALIHKEETISNPDGLDRIYDVTKVPVFYPSGGRKGLIVLGHDITERVQAEEALRESEQRMRIMFEEAPLGIALSDSLTGQFYEVNQRYADIAGRSIKEMITIDWMSITHPDDTQEDLDNMAQLSAGKISKFNMDKRFIQPDGSAVWFNMTVVPIKVGDDNHPCVLSMIEDMTERKKAEEQLKLQSLALDSASNAIVITDIEGTIEWANPAFTTLTGYSFEESYGKKPGDLVKSGLHDKSFYQSLWDTILAGKVWRSEMINKRKDGKLYNEEMTIAPLLSEEGEITNFVAIKQDITERLQAQENEQQHFQNIQFLAETAMNFVDFPPEKNIYRFICEKLKELAGEPIVVVNSHDETGDIMTTQAVLGMGKLSHNVLKILGRHPEGAEYNTCDENLAYLADDQLHIYQEGLYGISLGELPEAACLAIEKLYQISNIYTIGFVEGKRLVGSAVFFFSHGAEFKNEEAVELFVKQASIAIQSQLSKRALKTKMAELEIFNDAAVDRELLINDSRKEINQLLIELGKEPKYIIAE